MRNVKNVLAQIISPRTRRAKEYERSVLEYVSEYDACSNTVMGEIIKRGGKRSAKKR